MSSGKTCNIDVIIWKKIDDKYKCFINNCNIENNLKLDDYLKTNNQLKECYDKIIDTKEHQLMILNDNKIILECIEDIIIEIHIPIDDNLYLLSSISHKIRSPLNNIIGILTLFENLKLDKIQKKCIKILKNSSYEIVKIANDIIDIINLNKNEIKLTFEKINLNKFIHECYEIVAKDIIKKNLNFMFKIDENIPEIINIDSLRLKQIIINLLNNAINNTSIGGITLSISLFDNNNNNNEDINCPFKYIPTKPPIYNLLFKIKDTGRGIDNNNKNFIEKILGIKKSCINNIHKYSGFGLLISKYLCNLMGGNIWFKSEIDIGTIFYFNIICEGISLDKELKVS